jgi:ketopantoate reductase
VILCVKALPDVYDLASVIDAVVTPQHTCILVNTTHAIGLEAAIEERFPTNVVLSLVCGADLAQLGTSEFEHKGSSELWVGAANKNPNIPPSIQEDMAQALAMTLGTGQVDCKVSQNIRQQQFERVIGYVSGRTCSDWRMFTDLLVAQSLSTLCQSSSRRRITLPCSTKLAYRSLFLMSSTN